MYLFPHIKRSLKHVHEKLAKGFTFVEILVGLGIISVLSAGILTTINPVRQQQKGNDSKRKSDLGHIQKALDSYYNDHNRYPESSAIYTIRSVDNVSGTITPISWGIPWIPYMKQLPSDPQNPTNGYLYVSRLNGQEYMLCTSLQQTQDPQVCNSGNACARLTDPTEFNVPANSCGGRVCNFCVASSNITVNLPTPTSFLSPIPTDTPIPTATPTPTVTPTSFPTNTPTPTIPLGPYITINPTSGPVGTVITINGSGFAPNKYIYIVWNESQVFIPTTPTNSGGSFSVPFTIPSSTPGSKSIRVTVNSVSSNTVYFSVTSLTPTPTSTPVTKYVFVTTSTYQGNLGGLAGADTKCQDRANAGGLTGTWKAWLSDSSQSPSTRFNSSSAYRGNTIFKLRDGTIVANNWTQLTSGNLLSEINLTEYNSASSNLVWTNTNILSQIKSTANDWHCTNWTSTSSSLNGLKGAAYYKDNLWTDWHQFGCNNWLSLYCFQQ